ncbi:hypothetical protein [Stutzerimonas tarimensis]|uniref:Uncharacterized protein n=1 Tax=Stutzerimonas tarimensis TaxID=1507735 RepID=A0ABV7T939_9GAMM
MVIILLGAFCIWNAHHIFDWIDLSLGLEFTPDSDRTIRVRRFWAGVLAGVGVFAGVGKILWIYWYRKQAIKSAKGQWYDRGDISKEDFYRDEGDGK